MTDTGTVSHQMTAETMAAFIDNAKRNGASDNMVRRFKCTITAIYDYLPEDKLLTKERLLSWRKSMELDSYSSYTILNYVKHINRYLDFVGCSEIRFNRGKQKDLTGMTFGYLTAVAPTEKRDRNDVVWICKCKCGNTIELAATRLLSKNKLSCGCLKSEHLRRVNKNIGNTNLVQALDDRVESTRSVSGYTGVTPKRDKWLAYICYRGKRYSLGCYSKIEDAVKARARAKELVIEDALGLLDFYEEMHRGFVPVTQKPVPHVPLDKNPWVENSKPLSAAKRKDNKSGCVGVTTSKGKWEAKICYKGIRYRLGSFDLKEDAIRERKKAEDLLKTNPDEFVSFYSANYSHYKI